jgi:uncharacterized integral membrane protein
MSLIRLVLLLLILSGVTLFALQNWLPVLPLTILGGQTQALPLAVWMVGAIVAGAFTTLVFAGLFKLSNTLAAPRRSSRRAASRADEPDFTPPNSEWRSESAPAAQATANGRTTDSIEDDWEQSRRQDDWDDWSDYVEPADSAPPPYDSPRSYANSQTVIQDEPVSETTWEDWNPDQLEDRVPQSIEETIQAQRKIYEVPNQPKTRHQAGSVYSYSYRDASDSGAGKTEAVYDAEFRVIVPPYQPETEPQSSDTGTEDDEDWGFDDEDEFEERDRRKRSTEDW